MKKFKTINGDILLSTPLPTVKFVVSDLISEGLNIIGGSPKIGKSWMMLDLFIRYGNADISDRLLEAIKVTAAEYAEGIFRRLREHEYDPELMRLYVVGGGSCIIKNFGSYEKDRVVINDDICATAKGYEMLAEQNMRRKVGIV